MSRTYIVRYHAHDVNTLRVAAIAAAVKADLAFERVPISTRLQGVPLLEVEGSAPLFGANAVCRYLLSNAESSAKSDILGPNDQKDGASVEQWLEASEVILDGTVLKYLATFSRVGDSALTDTEKADALSFLSRVEGACSSSKGGALLSSFSFADVFLWAGLLPGFGAGGTLPAEEKSKYPMLSEWFDFVSSQSSSKDALLKLKCRSAASLLPPLAPRDCSAENFYISTAINYTNGNPHIGHSYEAVTSDMMARWHRVYGRPVYYQTGTDEHGQKIAQTAEQAGVTPQQICDKYAGAFQSLNSRMSISNDFYIRTTMEKHKKGAQALFLKAIEAGDIYLDTYEGWYNVREETFVTENEAALNDYKDPASGKPLQKMTEESYFFRMSKYQEAILQHIEKNPDFIQPDYRRNEIIAKLREPLRDLSVSRTTFDWGIPLPQHPSLPSSKKHVMYVWFDALSNYLTGCDWPEGPRLPFWPCSCHLIGKDIIWFHCVIWPAMLMSCGIALPKCVYAHGFINDKDGKKMSKSLGNVVDPNLMLDKYPSDTFRFYMAYAAVYGQDLNFSEEALITMHNAELADSLGNLVHRATNLTTKYCDGKVPADAGEPTFDWWRLAADMTLAMEGYNLQEAILAALNAVKDTNKFLTDRAPWHVKADPAAGVSEEDAAAARRRTVRSVLEALYLVAHAMAPFIPNGAAAILDKLSTPARTVPALSNKFDNLAPGTPIKVGDILYQKLEKEVVVAAEVFPCMMRVGRVESVELHPSQDTLFVCRISLGDQGSIQVCAGLRGKYEAAELQNRLVVVLLNLKAAEFKGVKSEGMLLVGDQQRPVKLQGLLSPDPSVPPGTQVVAEGAEVVVAPDMDLKVFQKLELKVQEGNKVAYKKTFALTANKLPIVAERVKEGSNVR